MRFKSIIALGFIVVIGLALGAPKLLRQPASVDVPSLADVGRFLFVQSRDAPEVVVVDGKSDRVVTRLATGNAARQVLVSEAAGILVASLPARRALELIDLASPASVTTLDLALAPEAVVLSPDGYLVAVSDAGGGSVAVVSLSKRQVLMRIPGFADARNLTFSLDGSQLYLTEGNTLKLWVIDIVQQKVVGQIPLGSPGTGGVSPLTRSADGRYGFVSLTDAEAVAVVDLGTLQPVKRLGVGRKPLRPYGTADGRLMLVPNDADRSVSVIDTATLEIAATLPGAKDVSAINTGWFESTAFVMSRENRIVVLDLMKFTKLGDIDLPGAPGPGVVTANGQKLYAPLPDAGGVAVIDTQTRKLRAVIEGAGREPAGVILARSNNYCH